MNKDEAKILTESLLEELNDLIDDINRAKKMVDDFASNSDLIKDDITEQDVIDDVKELESELSKLSISVKEFSNDSKKLKSLLNEIKLLKRKRQQRLKAKTIEEDMSKMKSDANIQLAKERARYEQSIFSNK